MKFTIALKMYCIVGLAFLALSAVAGLSYYIDHDQINSTDALIKEDFAQKELSYKAEISLGKAIQAYKNYLVRKDVKYVTAFQAAIGGIETDIKAYLNIAGKEDERAVAR